MKTVQNLSSSVSNNLSVQFSKNKHYLEVFLVTLLLLQYMPQQLNGTSDRFNKFFNPLFDPIKKFIKHPVVIVLLFLTAVYSYYVKKDMNLFFILLISMVAKKE